MTKIESMHFLVRFTVVSVKDVLARFETCRGLCFLDDGSQLLWQSAITSLPRKMGSTAWLLQQKSHSFSVCKVLPDSDHRLKNCQNLRLILAFLCRWFVNCLTLNLTKCRFLEQFYHLFYFLQVSISAQSLECFRDIFF